MFGLWNTTRANKENIIYAILTIFLLERVRTGWNKIETVGRKVGTPKPSIETKQDRFVVKASLLYALPLLLPVVKYVYRSIAELSLTVGGLAVLKNIWVFFGVAVLAECFLALVIYNLLRIYIDRLNSAIGFFSTIGRNIWDGSKTAVQVSSDVSSRVARGVRGLTRRAWGSSRLVVETSRSAMADLPGLTRTSLRRLRATKSQRDDYVEATEIK